MPAMKTATLALGLMLAGSPLAASAAEIVFANLAPATLDGVAVVVSVDGTPGRDEIAYRSFTRIAADAGPHSIRVDIAGDVLEVAVTAKDDDAAIVVLHGGGIAPYELDVHDAPSIVEALGAPGESVLLRHHYAEGDVVAPISEYECASGEGTVAAGQVMRRGETAYAALVGADHACTVRFRDAAFSVIEAEVGIGGANAHVFLAGDGLFAPYEALVFSSFGLLANGPIDFSPAGPSTAGPASLLDSPTFWFDADRPLQGVSLFELPQTGLVYGTWFGVDAAGRATWLAIEGSVVYGGALRDLRISELTRGPNGLAINVIGSGTLQYNDCNHAELRMFVRNSEYRTLRLERSRHVQACVALDGTGI